jgi:flavodoxin
MKTLIVYFSRTGATRKVATILQTALEASLEELKDTVDRSGATGYLIAGRDATLRRCTKLQPVSFQPADFDLVVIATPIWSWNLCVPIRTYLEDHKTEFKQLAFCCTMGGSGHERAVKDLIKIVNKTPLATLALTTKEVLAGDISAKVQQFVESLPA